MIKVLTTDAEHVDSTVNVPLAYPDGLKHVQNILAYIFKQGYFFIEAVGEPIILRESDTVPNADEYPVDGDIVLDPKDGVLKVEYGGSHVWVWAHPTDE